MRTEELDKRIENVLSGWEIPSKRGKKAIWHSIVNEIGPNQKRLISFEKWHWAAAASLVAVMVCFAIYYNSNIQYSTDFDKKITIALPDGSSLILNSDSRVKYNTISWSFNRSISLTGEAFFEVKNGSQFTVKTDDGIIKVLGTSFNVLSRNNNFLVECYTGKVEINNANNRIIISKGERVIKSENLELTKELSKQYTLKPTWIEGNYLYAKIKLVHVFNDISQHYNLTISRSDDIDEMSFTGEWNNSMSLEDVLNIVCLPFNLEAITKAEKEISIQLLKQ